VYRSRYGSPPTASYDESTAASTAVIGFGQVVFLDDTDGATHRIRRCSTAAGRLMPANIVGVSAGAGNATAAGSSNSLGTEDRKVSVWEAAPDVEYLFPFKGVIASTLVNTGLALHWDSTLAIHEVAANSTAANLTVRITGVQPGTVGDTGGYLIGRFFSSVVAPSISGI
jgi:hypothetical protein